MKNKKKRKKFQKTRPTFRLSNKVLNTIKFFFQRKNSDFAKNYVFGTGLDAQQRQ